MSVLRRWLGKVRHWFSQPETSSELETEIAQHLELLTDWYRRQGMTSDQAYRAARRQFGNPAIVREDRHQARTISAVETFWLDVRYAVRMIRRNRTFAAAVVVTMALAIGATTAIFSVYDAVLLKPLAYADPDRLVLLWEKQRSGDLSTVAPANFVDWRARMRSFTELAAIRSTNFVLTGHGEPARLTASAVSANFFRLLGTRMLLGRTFAGEEDQPAQARVAILTYAAWQHRLDANPGVIGSAITLNDLSYTVVGVLGPAFELVTIRSNDQPEIWVPLALDLGKLQRGTHPLTVFGRIGPGLTSTQVEADLGVVAAALSDLYPEDNKDKGIAAVPLARYVTKDVRPALTALLVGVGLLLLIACANVANLLLSRAAARQKEIAVRQALGASRARLGRQLLTESALLALCGGAGGLLFASVTVDLLGGSLPADLPRLSGLGIDGRVLGFTAFISLATGILFGLAPVFQGRHENTSEAMKQNTRGVSGVRSRLRNGLVIAQIAIALVLLSGAALAMRSFWNLLQVSPGFRVDNVLTARLSLPPSRYPDVQRVAVFQRELLDRVRRIPGVQAAGLTAYLPLGGVDNGWAFFIEGRPPLPVGVYNMAKYRPISPGYFDAIGIPVLEGRGFTDKDDERAPLVVVINEPMARTYWGTADPVGQHLRFGGPTPRTIVGVVGGVRHQDLAGDAKVEMYVPFAQIPSPERQPTIVVRTLTDPSAASADLRQTVSGIDNALPLDRIQMMERVMSASVDQPRFRTVLLAAFSALALVIASVGIYGVMNYLVSQRIREFGIRIAIGATRSGILRLVLRQAAVLVASGVALGLLGSALGARLITGLLYGVSPWDPLTFLLVPLLLSGVALLASVVPARRATAVDALAALRSE